MKVTVICEELENSSVEKSSAVFYCNEGDKDSLLQRIQTFLVRIDKISDSITCTDVCKVCKLTRAQMRGYACYDSKCGFL